MVDYFDYSNAVPDPKAMGVSEEGSMKQMSKNVNAILNYATYLGDGCNSVGEKQQKCKTDHRVKSVVDAARADCERRPDCEPFKNIKEGWDGAIYPLGNKYFTAVAGGAAKCKDIATGDLKTRYIYINNVPSGKIGGMKGLIPSLIEDMAKLNPISLFKSFTAGGGTMPCKSVTLETISTNGTRGTETHHMTLRDIIDLDSFVGNHKEFVKINKKLKGGGSTIAYPVINKSNFSNVYIFGFSIFLIYLLTKLARK